jgi:hypothetical protein
MPSRFAVVFWSALTILAVGGLFGVNVFRAATQSITHDEAVTYDRYCTGPLHKLVTSSDANNHVLNSILCRWSVDVFGLSEFTLRLPSVLGGLLFLAMAARASWRVWPGTPLPLLAVLFVGGNPFVMDYLSCARGYSLALGFWMLALDQMVAAFGDERAGVDARLRWASRSLALAVSANLTFLFAAVGLASCALMLAWRRSPMAFLSREHLMRTWRTMVRPGAIVFLCFALPLVKLRPSNFYFGAKDWDSSLLSIVEASLAHHPLTWPIDNRTNEYVAAVVVIALGVLPAVMLALALLWGFAARSILVTPPTDRPRPGMLLFHLAGGSLTLTLLLLAVAHAAIRMKLPIERTGMYLVPMFGLALLSAGSALRELAPHTRSWIGSSAQAFAGVVVALVCVVWGWEFQTERCRPCAHERDLRAVFDHAIAGHDPASKTRLRIGANWVLAPSLNFYRELRGVDYVERIRKMETYPDDCDVYISLSSLLGGTPPDEPVVEIYRTDDIIVSVPIRGYPEGPGQ